MLEFVERLARTDAGADLGHPRITGSKARSRSAPLCARRRLSR
jgi:hypothetical protein